jgi:hypothetical protein
MQRKGLSKHQEISQHVSLARERSKRKYAYLNEDVDNNRNKLEIEERRNISSSLLAQQINENEYKTCCDYKKPTIE